MSVRTDTGHTAGNPCTNALGGVLKACTRRDLESWVRLGDRIDAKIVQAQRAGKFEGRGEEVLDWREAFFELRKQLVDDMPRIDIGEVPQGGIPGVGVGSTIGDASARAMASHLLIGEAMLRSIGETAIPEEAPPSVGGGGNLLLAATVGAGLAIGLVWYLSRGDAS